MSLDAPAQTLATQVIGTVADVARGLVAPSWNLRCQTLSNSSGKGASAGPGQGISLRVATQNVWCHYLATPTRQMFERRRSGERSGVADDRINGLRYWKRLDLLARHLASVADVVVVQELFMLRLGPIVISHNVRRFVALMEDLGFPYQSDPNATLLSWAGQNCGVMIFSRFPMVACHAEAFRRTDEIPSSKGFVDVVIEIPAINSGETGMRVRVLGTHFDARSWPAKLSQLWQVADRLSAERLEFTRSECRPWEVAAVGRHTPTIVCGDFNICPQLAGAGGYDDGTAFSTLRGALLAAGLVHAWSASPSRGDASDAADVGAEPTADDEAFPLTEGRATLDHVWISQPSGNGLRLIARDVVAVFESPGHLLASDHLGLVVTVSIGDNAH